VRHSTFDPVWVSSREHLAEYDRIRKSTPWYGLFSSGKSIPSTFPQIDLDIQRTPLVYFSIGVLTLASERALYRAQQNADSDLGRRQRNLDTALSFSVERLDRPTIARHRETAGWLTYFHINWIEVALPTHTRSILLCVGGTTMGRVRRQTDALAAALSTWSTAGFDTA
jgi:hypothetical protein